MAIKSNYGESLASSAIIPVQVGDTHKLSITKVGVRDYGEYHCRASNLLDKDVSASMVLTGTSLFHRMDLIEFDIFSTAGSPSVPVILGETGTEQAYSYDVVWRVQSDYSLLQHEVRVL